MDDGECAGLGARGRSRPEFGVEAVFEESDGSGVGPRGSSGYEADGGPVDAGSGFDLAKREAFGDTGEPAAELSHGQHGRFVVAEPSGRPVAVKNVSVGGFSGGSGHSETLGVIGDGVPETGNPLHFGSHAGNVSIVFDNRTSSESALMNRLLTFEPSKSEYASTWRAHRHFLGELVLDAAPLVNHADRRLMVALLPFVGWLSDRGYDIDRETVLNRTNVEAFLSAASDDFSVGSLRTFRSCLVAVIAGLGGDVEPLGGAATFSRSTPGVPYTEDEQGWLVAWATTRLNDYTRRNTKLAVALGLGAGLTSGEAMTLNRSHVSITDDGVAVEVPGSRLVIVHRSFEDLFIGAFTLGDPHAPLLLADAMHRDCKTLNKFLNVQRRRADIAVNSRMMRTTWIVRHLTESTPADALIRAAGVATLAGLTRFMQFVPERPDDSYRLLMRGAVS